MTIEERAEELWPSPRTVKDVPAYVGYIEGALVQREIDQSFMEWASKNGWFFGKDGWGWWKDFKSGSKTYEELFKIYEDEND